MKLKWLGHSCFLITSDAGSRVLTDPYDSSIGYGKIYEKADVVSISHKHSDHSDTSSIKGIKAVFDTSGMHAYKDIQAQGTPTYHDKDKGAKRGTNIVFNFMIDSLNICHMGDLGHIPDELMITSIGNADVLLIPIGGFYTIDHSEAYDIINLIKPQVVIPMHYKTEVLDFPISGPNEFMDLFDERIEETGKEIEINTENLSSLPALIKLSY